MIRHCYPTTTKSYLTTFARTYCILQYGFQLGEFKIVIVVSTSTKRFTSFKIPLAVRNLPVTFCYITLLKWWLAFIPTYLHPTGWLPC